MDQPMNIDVNSLETLTCDNCNHTFFQQLYIIKKISAIQSPSGQETMMPVPVFACLNCGRVIGEEPENSKGENNLKLVTP